LGHELHSLDDPSWSYEGALFGPSRRIDDRAFGELAGWRPHFIPAAECLSDLRRSS
jgi:hypothetical protein